MAHQRQAATADDTAIMTTTRVLMASCVNKISTYGNSILLKMRICRAIWQAFASSDGAPSGILGATLGSCVLLLPTIPLMSAARWASAWQPSRWADQDNIG
jgi:hypothetical protein